MNAPETQKVILDIDWKLTSLLENKNVILVIMILCFNFPNGSRYISVNIYSLGFGVEFWFEFLILVFVQFFHE